MNTDSLASATEATPPGAEATSATAQKPKESLLKVARERHGAVEELLQRAGQVASNAAPDAAAPAATGHLDVDYVHDLRVATRRLEEAAGITAVVMDKLAARAIAESLKGLRRAAGDLRDLDVACEHLTAGGKWRMPGTMKLVGAELVGQMQGRRGELEAKLREQAGSGSLAGAMVLLARTLEEFAAADKSPAAEARLRKELDKHMGRREKQLRKAFGKAVLKQTAESLHEARIAAKKLRYVLELADAGGVGRQKKRLGFLKGVQKLLGEHHDVHVVEAMVGARVAEKGAGMKGLPAEWRKWKRAKEREQGERAAEFFVRSYGWMNGERGLKPGVRSQ